MWTRMLLISIAENLKDLDATETRLLKNPKDIANIFKMYYGNTIANRIQELLTEHLAIGKELIVALKNKNDLLDHHIRLLVNIEECLVLTDSKWLEFIISQIISNSIKYCKSNSDSYIKLTVKDLVNRTVLLIEDNGIGISSQDIDCVFDKTFTGQNGRLTFKSTGMGLYIVKKLCDKLGHRIEIQSKEGQWTKVMLTFYDHDFYKIKD